MDGISNDYELYDCDTWKVLGTGQNVKEIVWGLQSDTIAILKLDHNSKRLSIFKVVEKKFETKENLFIFLFLK